MNKIILSFDYEIYFDGSNRYQALLENTTNILEIARRHNVSMVFFIDVYYLIKLEEKGLLDIYRQITNQIHLIVKDGHEIQYHYHPHWIHAEYDSEQSFWKFNQSEYSLSDIISKYGKEYAFKSFNLGLDKMRGLFAYKPLAYRSGGLSIDGNQSELIQLLIDNGFKFDSSVMPGLFLHGTYIHIDHTKAPNLALWRIDAESGFMREAGNLGSYLDEIPVMSLKKQELQTLKRLFTSLSYRVSAGSVKQSQVSAMDVGKPFDLEINQSTYPISITFDKSGTRDIILLKYFTGEYFRKKQNLMCILSHPKSFLQQSFGVLDAYLTWVKRSPESYSFKVFKDLI